MKQMLLVVLAFIPVCLLSQTRKQAKYAEKFDVLKYLPQESDRNPATFWKAITQNNDEFQKNIKKFEDAKGLAKQSKREVMNDAYKFKIQRQMYRRQTDEDVAYCKTVRIIMLGDENSEMDFEIVENQEPNAYCTPDGYVCIYTGILERLKSDIKLMIGILAHEITHYKYQHALILRHKTLKKERENAIGAAINHVGESILNMPDKEQRIQNIYDRAQKQTDLYNFKYSRDEELEADIVAYRFLDWMGIDPSYYDKALRYSEPFGASHEEKDDNDHPTTPFRLGVLSALKPSYYGK